MAERQRSLPGFEDDPQTPLTSDAVENRPAPKLDRQSVYVIDAHALIYQVFHALPEMTSPSGQPVGAILGFIRDVVDLLERKRPDYLYCAFDTSTGTTFRHDVYGDYKAHREAMPEDLRPQIPHIERLLQALGVPVLRCENYEADDILATLARSTYDLGGHCFLVTNDKDCRQLINDRVQLYNIRTGQYLDAGWLLREWGIRPDQVVDFQALVGDSVDNIPGVPLIGPKLAREMLQQYETLEGVFAHVDRLRGKKRRQNLVTYHDRALLSRHLVRLDCEVPIELDWREARVGRIDMPRVNELCLEFGFRRLADQVSRLAVPQTPRKWDASYRTVTSADELSALVARLSQQPRIAFRSQTATANGPRWAEVIGYAFAWQPGEACYIPVRGPSGDPRLDLELVLSRLRPLLEDPRVEKVGHNLKSDLVILRTQGIRLAGVCCDTMVADYLLAPGHRNHGLDDLALRYLEHARMDLKQHLGTGKRQRRCDELAVELVSVHAAEGVDIAIRMAEMLERQLAVEGLEMLFGELEMPLIEVLAEMEFNGIQIDIPQLNELSRRYGAQMADRQTEIYELAGRPFNIDSRAQLAEILFQELQLPVIKRTKTGASTDVDVLNELAKQHSLPAKIVEYRQFAKLKSTYVDALPALVHPQTGRIHTSFRQDVAATGRLSSTDPNLQNIPIRTAAGREIRSAFVPAPRGWQLLTADYSQIELRVLAHYSRDEALQRAFAEDLDIHAMVASQVYGVPLDEVTSAMRRSAKAVNFGVIYGQSPFGLAKALDIAQEEAAQFIDTYFAQYSGVENFIEKVLEQCRRNGYVSTILGRRRAVRGVRSPARGGGSRLRSLPERVAINTVIQGSAADLIKQAMIRVRDRMQREQFRARMLLQIHDELVFEVPSDELTNLATLVTEEMTAAGQLDVPLRVDLEVGTNWADCKPLGDIPPA